ncbi:hypothetical protein [Aliivibrio fischeri]|uniref:hypothetical protein n=1 Tax=Aliivibrio fischeri TaxID=668 RepID=UPI00080ECF44|nr:hypothetical protein [Aliivibrio fischeri]OCH02944.1 hypothetical protein A6E11_03760 [Aliivibrio fischeri]
MSKVHSQRKQKVADLNLTVDNHLRQLIVSGKHHRDEHSKYIIYKVGKLAQRKGISFATALDMFINNQHKLQQSDLILKKTAVYCQKIKERRKQSKRKTIHNSSIRLPAGLISQQDWKKTK